MKKVIVLGNDHTNSLGVVQTLGKSGFEVYAFVWGAKTGLLDSSRYATKVYGSSNEQECIKNILQTFVTVEERIPIIACCDSAALALEKNSDRLKDKFVFEYSGKYTFEYLFKKENQVKLAIESGFNVPKTWNLSDSKEIPEDVVFPCLIKPLVSCEGAKCDIRVCENIIELKQSLNTLKCTSQVLIQQYIDKDFELCILGCALKNGDVIIPCEEKKLSIYPKKTGLVCFANLQPLNDGTISHNIKCIIKSIGYVGIFSVELMHNKEDDKFYFTEVNLRNDGGNSFVYKYGANLPLNHIEDLGNERLTIFTKFNPGYYIWDMHHFLSLMHRETSFTTWLAELMKSRGFITYFPDDRKPFFKQYTNWILSKFHLRKEYKY